jgi:hypothetical protein
MTDYCTLGKQLVAKNGRGNTRGKPALQRARTQRRNFALMFASDSAPAGHFLAADLPQRPAYKAPMMAPAPVVTWTGWGRGFCCRVRWRSGKPPREAVSPAMRDP